MRSAARSRSSSTGTGKLGLAFAESSTFIDITSDATTGGPRSRDGAIMVDVAGPTDYTTPDALQRGGFRFLTLFLDSGSGGRRRPASRCTTRPRRRWATRAPTRTTSTRATRCSTASGTRAPTRSRRTRSTPSRAARGRAGRAVVQHRRRRRRRHDPHRRRQARPHGLAGRPRRRVPVAYVSTGDTVSTRNALTTMYDHQSANGALPYSGPPLSKYGLGHLPPVDAVGDRRPTTTTPPTRRGSTRSGPATSAASTSSWPRWATAACCT